MVIPRGWPGIGPAAWPQQPLCSPGAWETPLWGGRQALLLLFWLAVGYKLLRLGHSRGKSCCPVYCLSTPPGQWFLPSWYTIMAPPEVRRALAYHCGLCWALLPSQGPQSVLPAHCTDLLAFLACTQVCTYVCVCESTSKYVNGSGGCDMN